MGRRNNEEILMDPEEWRKRFQRTTSFQTPRGPVYGNDARRAMERQTAGEELQAQQEMFGMQAKENERQRSFEASERRKADVEKYLSDLRSTDDALRQLREKNEAEQALPENRAKSDFYRNQLLYQHGFNINPIAEKQVLESLRPQGAAVPSRGGGFMKPVIEPLGDIVENVKSDKRYEGQDPYRVAQEIQNRNIADQNAAIRMSEKGVTGQVDDGLSPAPAKRPEPIYGRAPGIEDGMLKVKGKPMMVYDPVIKDFRVANDKFNPLVDIDGEVYRASDVDRYYNAMMDGDWQDKSRLQSLKDGSKEQTSAAAPSRPVYKSQTRKDLSEQDHIKFTKAMQRGEISLEDYQDKVFERETQATPIRQYASSQNSMQQSEYDQESRKPVRPDIAEWLSKNQIKKDPQQHPSPSRPVQAGQQPPQIQPQNNPQVTQDGQMADNGTFKAIIPERRSIIDSGADVITGGIDTDPQPSRRQISMTQKGNKAAMRDFLEMQGPSQTRLGDTYRGDDGVIRKIRRRERVE